MNPAESLDAVADQVEATFKEHGVTLTLGGEPTYVPINPDGSEWNITALGPTKLSYAYALANALTKRFLPNAQSFYSPGKSYPGELNPRWAIYLLWNRDGSALIRSLAAGHATGDAIETFKSTLLRLLKIRASWLRAIDGSDPERSVWVLPLDHDGKRFTSADWRIGDSLTLLRTEGPAGLRLPLNLLPTDVSRRALVIEVRDERFHAFFPPLLQKPFLALLELSARALRKAKIGPVLYAGYIPEDDAAGWTKLAIAADPGVLEVNLPPCSNWHEYDRWMRTLEQACSMVGLRSFKQINAEEALGTGGGNHLLFGGPTLSENPLFTRPKWVTSMLRYWQHHPSLSYLFTGVYVGPSSQAPRPDESTSALYDLEMAYQFLEQLPPGDHRYLISETLRHLHTDGGGNTHRSETSFDKFWNINFEGGCRGLVEFRAVESLPHADWMSAVALLWRALAAYLLAHPFEKRLIDQGERLHDYYFLPANLWRDFEEVLRDLRKAGFSLPAEIFRAIANWRFPVMLSFEERGATLTIRKAHEGWPLLCEQPLEGGNTSRFVDTSIERLEFIANRRFAQTCKIEVQGRRLLLRELARNQFGVGLRYRRSALYPSLHPGIAPQTPLMLVIRQGRAARPYRLDSSRRLFESVENAPAPDRRPCKTLHEGLLTCDLRLP